MGGHTNDWTTRSDLENCVFVSVCRHGDVALANFFILYMLRVVVAVLPIPN